MLTHSVILFRANQNVSSFNQVFLSNEWGEICPVHWGILQNWEILETRNLFCAAGYFCNRQSCPSKGWLCRESSETVLKKVEIGAKNLRKHFLENISYRLFRTFLNTLGTTIWWREHFLGVWERVIEIPNQNEIMRMTLWNTIDERSIFETKFKTNFSGSPVKQFSRENSIEAGGLDKSHVFPIHSVTCILRLHNNITNWSRTPGVQDNFGIFGKLNLAAKKVQGKF